MPTFPLNGAVNLPARTFNVQLLAAGLATAMSGDDAGRYDRVQAVVASLADANAPTSLVFISAAQAKAEGNSGNNIFTYTVTRSLTVGALSVPWTFSAGGTIADDFTGSILPSGGVVNFADGVATGTFSISVLGDLVVEPDEVFTVSILPPFGTAPGGALSATGTILNDDQPVVAPTLALSGALAQAEGNSGTSTFTWTLTLTRNGSTASYPYTYAVTGNGSNPANAADFGGTFPSGSGTFAAGETSKSIVILVAGDTAVEPSETFLLTVTSTDLGTLTSTGTITNDDVAAPTLSQPTISPTSGSVGQTFTGTDGTVANGTFSGRRWLLGTTVIGTGTTVTPNASGSLTLENTAVGTNGATITATSAAVNVTAAVSGADFTMSQLAAPNRVYQRQTTTGGGQGKGTGTIPVPVTVNTVGTPRFRIRSSDGTILQGPTALGAFTATGAQTLPVTGVDARLGFFYVDLSVDGTTWQNGTVLVGMGRLIALSGQSLAVRKMASFESNKSIASFGIAINPNGMVYCTYQDSRTVSTPAWALPADGTGYDSTYEAEFLRLEVPAAGVNCAIVGHSHGGTGIDAFITQGNTDYNALSTIIQAVGGFEAFIWDHGHANSGDGGKGTYGPKLTTLFNNMTAWNGVRGNNYTRVVDTIPAITNGYGPVANINALRADMAAWCAANNAIFSCPLDIDLQDGIHPTQTGGIDTARHDYRVLRPSVGLPNDDNGPTLGTATRSGTVITINPVIKSGFKLVPAGSPATRFLVANKGTTSALAIASATVTDTQIALTLSADPGSSQELDLYFGYPWDPINKAGQDMIRDNVLDSNDNLTLGRHLQANQTPVAIAAPGGSTPTPTPTVTKLGPDLTSNSVTYSTSAANFGQARSGGYAAAVSNDGSDVLAATNTWAMEVRFQISSAPSGTKVMSGVSSKCWLGVATDGRLIANFVATGGDTYLNGTTASGGGSNPVVSDGNWHHVALVANGASGALLFLDGALIGTSTAVPKTGAGSSKFNVGAFNNDTQFVFTGLVDEVATWATAKYTAAFTPKTTPYVGSEGMMTLYHLNGDLTAAYSDGSTGGSTPAAFTAQPTVSPASGTAGSTTFTATPGTVSNGTIASRSWKLSGTEISTGLTAAPAAAGTLTYQEFATGSGGNASSNVISMTVTAAATSGPVGANFTASTDLAYGTGKFGQAITKGYATSPDKDTGWPRLSVYTIELWIKGAPSGTAVAFGAIARGYIGMADGKALFHFTTTSGEPEIKSTGLINDGNWHHLALVSTGSKFEAFLDGVSIGTNANPSSTAQPGQKTAIGAFLENGDYGFCQDGTKGCGIDEVAIWNTARYTAAFTPPTAPYSGGETGLIGLYHLNGSTLSGNQ